LKEEILKVKQQMEEGTKFEEIMKNKYLEKEKKYQVDVNILKDKLEEKDKHLLFQDSTKILDNILSSQRFAAMKYYLGTR